MKVETDSVVVLFIIANFSLEFSIGKVNCFCILKFCDVFMEILPIKFLFYKLTQNFDGEWIPSTENGEAVPLKDNVILGHVLHRMFSIVSPPAVSFFTFFDTLFYLCYIVLSKII